MRINDEARKAVVFFGVPGNDGIVYRGTGFLLYDKDDGILIPFLVTARHVAQALNQQTDTGFFVRVNTRTGSAEDIHVDNASWAFHPDPTVDLAAINFSLSNSTYDAIYYPLQDPSFGLEDRVARLGTMEGVLCGDPIAIVGLFRLHSGKQRNVPIVHSGHISALPDAGEPIPIRNPRTSVVVEAECYLVEAQTLEGLSGSPVFTNEALSLQNVHKVHGQYPHVQGALVLLGLYVGAWDGQPGEILANDRSIRGGLRVPVGMGLVVPVQKIIELVRGDAGLNAYRKARVAGMKAARVNREDSAAVEPPEGPPAGR